VGGGDLQRQELPDGSGVTPDERHLGYDPFGRHRGRETFRAGHIARDRGLEQHRLPAQGRRGREVGLHPRRNCEGDSIATVQKAVEMIEVRHAVGPGKFGSHGR
jgi:hypothetical protein